MDLGYSYDDAGEPADEAGETADSAAQYDVALCSGEVVKVQTSVEQRWFEATRDKYLTENKFTATTDLQDVDRLLVLELALFRWTQHLASGYDYQKNLVDDDLIRRQIKDQSDVITKLKASLGLDKKSRDAALNEGNFATWFADAKRRARLFGIHRENQINVGIALLQELSAVVGSFDRSDEEERRKLGYQTEADIVAWIRDHLLPEFKKVDEYFLENEQKLWKRDL